MFSNQDGTSCLASTRRSNKSLVIFIFLSLKNEVARPRFPTRPVRPMRCTYSSISLGKSKLITCFTFEMSSPLAATAVATKLGFFLSGTGEGPLLCLSEIDLHEYWYKHILHGTRNPPENLHLFWSPQILMSVNPCLLHLEGQAKMTVCQTLPPKLLSVLCSQR